MNIFVGGSSRNNLKKIYYEEAKKLSKYLHNKNHNLIIGCDMGIIKEVASSLSKNKVTIIEAKPYQEENYKYEMQLLDSIKERKNRIIEISDILIFLPGGIGSLDEIFTSIESKRANEHNKEIIIVNINNYYDNLIKMLDIMYKEHFADPIENLYIIKDSIEDLINYFKSTKKD